MRLGGGGREAPTVRSIAGARPGRTRGVRGNSPSTVATPNVQPNLVHEVTDKGEGFAYCARVAGDVDVDETVSVCRMHIRGDTDPPIK